MEEKELEIMKNNEFKFNEKQTKLTDKNLSKLSRYVKEELIEAIDSIPFIANLISSDRPYAKDLKKDKHGKIEVNIESPHILEDMDYFRQPALHFKKHGVYTKAFRSRHPKSEYRKFWDEEINRCLYGLVRKSDGEWISGYNYFYWNYAPILLTEDRKYEEDEIKSISENLDKELDNLFSDNEELIQADRVEDFPEPWDGDYLFFHYVEKGEKSGLYGAVIKTRGRGYSFKVQSMFSRNYNIIKRSKSYAIASEAEFLIKDGILNKAWDNLSFINTNTAWSKKRQKIDKMMHKKSSFMDLTTSTERGYLSEIIGVTLKNDVQKARGKRGKLIAWEEAGQFPGLLTAWGIARPSLEQGRSVFGYMIAFGTGGSATEDFAGLETLFYQAKAYRVLSLINVFDKNASKNKCGFYIGEYLNRAGCYDKDGNSDVIKALIEVFKGREVIIKETSDPQAIVQEKADRSITPQEACMRVEGNLFPVSDLKDYLSDIQPNLDNFLGPHSVGRIGIDASGNPVFMSDTSLSVTREYPLKNNKNKKGAVEVFEHPQKMSGGGIPSYRYIAGIDSYDRDESTTDSLGSIIIFDTWTETIAAEFTGRPDFASDFYETCKRLLMYYNAKANYENLNLGLFTYFKNNNCLNLLVDRPSILRQMDFVKGEPSGNAAKGTPPTKHINAWGRRLQADWMKKVGVNENIDDHTINLRKIRSIAYIKEAIHWHIDANADRISAMNMVMILWEEVKKIIESGYNEDEVISDKSKDNFFKVNYNGFGYKGNFRV